MQTFKWKAIQNALVGAFAVPEDELGAFEAKLRHLRDVGLVRERPGSGTQLSYDWDKAAEFCIALECTQLGLTPREAAAIACVVSIQSEGVVLRRSQNGSWRMSAARDGDAGKSFLYIDVKGALERLDRCLRNQPFSPSARLRAA